MSTIYKKMPQKSKQVDIPSSASEHRIWKRIGYIALIAGILGGIAEVLNVFNSTIIGSQEGSVQLTVYVQDKNRIPIKELEGKGHVLVDFGNDRRFLSIGEHGRTNMDEIPEKFLGKRVPISLQMDGYEVADSTRLYLMNGDPVYLFIQRSRHFGLVQGIVKDRPGDNFISGAMVMIDNDTTIYTDKLGRFSLLLPPEKRSTTYEITVKKDGYKTHSDYYHPGTRVEIRLEK